MESSRPSGSGPAPLKKASALAIRPMTEEDLGEVLRIERLSFPQPWSREAYRREMAQPFSVYVVAEDEEGMAGYAGMWVILDEAHVTTLAVDPSKRGRGVGSRLLEHLEEEARRRGAATMLLEVRPSNRPALALYERRGFTLWGRRRKYYSDNQEDALLMGKVLGP